MSRTYTTQAGWPANEDEPSLRIESVEENSNSSYTPNIAGVDELIKSKTTNQFVLPFTQLRVMVKRNFIFMVRMA